MLNAEYSKLYHLEFWNFACALFNIWTAQIRSFSVLYRSRLKQIPQVTSGPVFKGYFTNLSIQSRILSVCTQNLYTIDKFVKSTQIPEYLDDFSVMNISSNFKPLAESGQIHINFLQTKIRLFLRFRRSSRKLFFQKPEIAVSREKIVGRVLTLIYRQVP